MKRFRANMAIYIALPALVTILILIYMIIMYDKSYRWINIINIALDVVVMLVYFYKFCHEVSIDTSGIVFITAFGRKRIKREDYVCAVYSSFLVKIICKSRNYYVLTTRIGRKALESMLNEIKK